MATSTVLERTGLNMLADEDQAAESNVIKLETVKVSPVAPDATPAGPCSDFELFLADLKAGIEQPLLASMVQDLRAMLSKLKGRNRIDADQGAHPVGLGSLNDE